MILTLGEAISKTIKLIDEYSINGKVISNIKNADYLNKMKEIADMAQMELARFSKIPAIYEFVQAPYNNLITDEPTQKIVYHTSNDIVYSALGALSFYFEVDNLATIYLKQGATTLATINNAVVGSFQEYKDLIVGDPNLQTTLTFSGPNSYNVRNIALYSTPYATKGEIPRFSIKRRYKMPDDFMTFDKFIAEGTDESYLTEANFYWEKPNVLLLDYKLEGTIRISYFRYPTKITKDTPDDYQFELTPEVSNLIPYYLAWITKSTEEPQFASQFRRIYETMLANIEVPKNLGMEIMTDVNNW